MNLKKRITALLCAFAIAVTPLFAFAEEEQQPQYDTEHMKKVFNAFLNVTARDYRFGITKEELLQSSVESMIEQHPELFDELAKGAYNALDEHSFYLTKDEYAQRLEDVSQQFEGIGVTLSLKNGKAIILKVHKNTPALIAGLKAGDVITAVNGEDITGLDLDGIVSKVRGEKGTSVDLTVSRGAASIDFTVLRNVISVETVEYENLNKNNSGYIRIDSFSANTFTEFVEAVGELQNQGVDKVILDLRNNGGGYLSAAVNIASFFVPKGKLIVTEDYGDENKNTEYYSEGDFKRLGVVVLANEYSASASEIVTGAIKENNVGKIVGNTTFGKGTVQTSRPVSSYGAMWLTVAQYNLPKGDNIHDIGIEPDYKVENTAVPVDLSGLKPITKQRVMSYGDTGEDVAALKEYLNAIGFEFLNMDDKYDDELVAAITSLQTAAKLYPYGVADFTTQDKVLELASKAERTDDKQLEKAKELIFSMK